MVLLRNRTEVSHSGLMGNWPPGRLCPACGNRVWRIRLNRYGNPSSHLDKFGKRSTCPSLPDPNYCCTKCQKHQRSHTGKPPRGWITRDTEIICTKCKSA